MRPVFTWNLGDRSVELGKRTLVMGIVNVTPDSFSDGGLHLTPEAAIAHALKLLDEGADMIDVGGESTRPEARVGAENPAVSAQEELRRVLPVIAGVKKERASAIISVDTYKAQVARTAVEAGAEIVNDVSGLQWDPSMKTTLAGLNCGVVLMHTRGRPDEWRSLPAVPDLVLLTKRELRERSDAAVNARIKRDRIVLDPGFGFGKRLEENYPLLRRFSEFQELRFPLLAGVSRKSFVGRALSKNENDAAATDRQFGTLGAEVALALKGAHIIRTHDVRACVEALKLADVAAN
ncbi:MAG: Dihydropteroate synthase [Acidobacteriaceae bacterium]|nr:Dihydropteroate synthase [Acidobacteriaceae bacterium]